MCMLMALGKPITYTQIGTSLFMILILPIMLCCKAHFAYYAQKVNCFQTIILFKHMNACMNNSLHVAEKLRKTALLE